MGLFNEYSSTTKTDSSISQIPGPQGIGFKLDDNGNFDIENKKLTNVKNGDKNNDVMNNSQIESYVSEKTIYLKNVNPGQVINNKAVIYSNTGSVHSNALYLKDRYGQETILHNEDQDDNQIRLYIPNLKNNDSYGNRLKSSVMVTSISQTIEGKKIFHDIEVPSPTIDGHASNKAYVDNQISKISDSSDNSNYVKKSGDMMNGKLLLPNVLFPIQGDLRQALSYESMREIFLSRRENTPMRTNLNMSNHTIDNIKNGLNRDQVINKGQIDDELSLKADKSDLLQYLKTNGSYPMKGSLNMGGNRITGLTQLPFYNGEAVNKRYVDNQMDLKADKTSLNNYLKLDGSKSMEGNLNMNNNLIQNVKDPINENNSANKKYVDNSISKSIIKPSHIPNNVFKYLMDDVNEWSTEYNVEVKNFINLNEIPHSWNKRVLSISPIKDGKNYRFRLGLQMAPLITNQAYSLVVEMYNRDFVTWERQETFIEGTGVWLKTNNTIKFQHHYGNNNTIYYSKTLIKFNKTSFSESLTQIYFTIHFDDKGGDLNTYSNKFENQIYILAYGALGDINNISSMIYDKHEAYVIEKTKIKMLVPLDMNGFSILNSKNMFTLIGGMVNQNGIFVHSNMNLRETNITIFEIYLYPPSSLANTQDHLRIKQTGVLQNFLLPFTYSASPKITKINTLLSITSINYLKLVSGRNLPFKMKYMQN